MHSDEDGLDQDTEKTSGTLASKNNSKEIKKAKQKRRDVLEVEDDEQRLTRLQHLLESMNAESPIPSSSQSTTTFPTQLPLPQLAPSKPFSVPKSEVLSRLESFLPQIERANAELLKQAQSDPASVDIENISDGQATYIEMNLGLGVFEQKERNAGVTAATDSNSSDSDSNDDDETRSSDSSASDLTLSSEVETQSDITDASSNASPNPEESSP